MRRRLAIVLAAVGLAAAVGLFAPVSPAAATSVCAGTGSATTGSPLFAPGVGGPTSTSFGFVLVGGSCVGSKSGVTASGSVNGFCGLAFGQGSTDNGANFAFVGVGPIIVVTGHVVAVLGVAPDLANGEDCLGVLGAGADSFLLAGAGVLLHCASLASSLTPAGPFMVHTSTCVPGAL